MRIANKLATMMRKQQRMPQVQTHAPVSGSGNVITPPAPFCGGSVTQEVSLTALKDDVEWQQ